MIERMRAYLEEQIGQKPDTAVEISELERIAGNDWLAVLQDAALRANVNAAPHPKDSKLILVTR